MRYYTIQDDSILIADNKEALIRYYDNVFELPEDYEEGKYIIGEQEKEIDVPDYETVTEEYTDENGEIQTSEVQKPVIFKIEETIVVPDYDEEGNVIGSHEVAVIKHKQQTHKEIVMIKVLVLNPDWEQEQAEKERVRIANLHLTRGDVFRGLLLAKGVTRADIRALIEAMPDTTPQEKINKEMALIDFDEALEFYRGVALIDTLGVQLGITSKQMDRFFDTKDWHELTTSE